MLNPHPDQVTLFKAVHHALIIYSLIVVFPLPLSSAPFPELAAELEPDVSQLLNAGRGDISRTLLLWISTMATLAAIDTPQRASLVATTAQLCRDLQIYSWEALEAVLQDYLWSEDISDFDGLYLYLEVQDQMLEQETILDEDIEAECARNPS
jgi:hypothetical protein